MSQSVSWVKMNITKTFPKILSVPLSARTLAECVGDYIDLYNAEENIIKSVASPQNAEDGSIVFCNKKNIKQIQELVDHTKATVVVVSMQVKTRDGKCLILVEDPVAWYIHALNVLFGSERVSTIHESAVIPNDALIGESVNIGAGTFVDEDCNISNGCSIGVNCYLGPGTVLGENVFIQNNVSIGGVGLGYHITSEKEQLLFPHIGSVLMGRDVVIGAGSVVVRGQMQDTVIGDKTRVGNLVNIGHNVVIGQNCAVSSGTCIAGGTIIGDRCNIAVGVSINAKINIGDDCKVGLGSVVVKDIPDGESVFGVPAKSLRTMRNF